MNEMLGFARYLKLGTIGSIWIILDFCFKWYIELCIIGFDMVNLGYIDKNLEARFP